MKDTDIMIESLSNSTVVIDLPEIPLRRTWTKAGSKYPIDREVMERAFYDYSVEMLFREGILTTDDAEFLKNVGLMSENNVAVVVKTNDAYFNRMIKLMPLAQFKTELVKLTASQRQDLADYAIEHYIDLNMDRIDLLSKASGKNILKAIEYIKADQEG